MSIFREIGAWIVGLTVWGSSLAFMIHGLWTGSWYGYVFAALFIVLLAIILLPMYFIGRITDEQMLEMIHEMERESSE